jgi:RHS repeat-associated protein
MAEQNVAGWATPYQFNAKELDENTGLYYYGARYYDPRISVWHGVDPLADMYPDWSPYTYTMNNPITYWDPTGMGTEDVIYKDQNGDEVFREKKEGPDVIIDVFSIEIKEIKGPSLAKDNTNVAVFQKDVIFGCPTCLDKSTLFQNIFDLTYPGGNNPKSYDGKPNYDFIPTSLAEYPAIGHDRRYDRLGTAGAAGLFFDTKAIGADWQFVKEQLFIASLPISKKDRLNAMILGIGLGACALPKTLYQHAKGIRGKYETSFWYHYSNIGVTNIPSNPFKNQVEIKN